MTKKLELVARPVLHVATRVSIYDRVSGGLAAGVVVAGALAVVLICLWFSQAANIRSNPDSFVTFTSEVSNDEGVASEVAEPEFDDAPDWQTAEWRDAVGQVNVAAVVRANDGDSQDGDHGVGEDPRIAIVPSELVPTKRWKLVFSVDRRDAYAELLDQIGVELGGVERMGSGVAYVKDFGGETTVRTGEKQQERRVYFSHTLEQFRRWDLELLSQAKVEDVTGRVPLHFYPSEVLSRMYAMECAQVRQDGRDIGSIQSTIFRFVLEADGYDIKLDGITYVQ